MSSSKLLKFLQRHSLLLLKSASLFGYVIAALLVVLYSRRYGNYITFGAAVLLVAIFVTLIILFLRPWGKRKITEQLYSIGFTNYVGEPPDLIRKFRDPDYTHVTILEFRNPGIALSKWEKGRDALEAALNITIIDLSYHIDKRRVTIRAVSAKSAIPPRLEWSDNLLSTDEFTLVLGKSALGPVILNLAQNPHIMLGGNTGCGKTVLLKFLLFQSLKKGAQVIISDFKGGIDFPHPWHERCTMCFDEQTLLEQLDFLVTTLEERRSILVESNCRNLEEYNKINENTLPRLILACDEVAEIFNKLGSKTQKEIMGQIENRLSLIARQGRAFGIHLIFSTQRPSADLIPGQIRTNLGFRVCGRADAILSKIILDSPIAEQISKNARGRFMLADGTLFQSYWFDEMQL